MRRHLELALAAALLCAVQSAAAVTTDLPPAGLPSASDYAATLVPEREGVVSWRTLAQVQPVKQGAKIVPEFSKEILALDRKDQKVQGFMIPLDTGERQKRFLITAVPLHCSFCLPAGPDAIVEIVAKNPVKYTFDPIVVAGRFEVVRDDANGILYRLTDATQVELPPAPAKAKAAK